MAFSGGCSILFRGAGPLMGLNDGMKCVRAGYRRYMPRLWAKRDENSFSLTTSIAINQQVPHIFGGFFWGSVGSRRRPVFITQEEARKTSSHTHLILVIMAGCSFLVFATLFKPFTNFPSEFESTRGPRWLSIRRVKRHICLKVFCKTF